MKTDVVFYQQYAAPYFGILSVSSHLCHHGFRTDVIIDSLENNSISALKKLNPRLIGISVLSTEHGWLIEKVDLIRRELPNVPIIVGGIHAMFYPEEILRTVACDLVCNSEGEEVLSQVLNELDKSVRDWSSIPGLSYRDNNKEVRHTEIARLVAFKDDIIEDRKIYYERYPQLAKDEVHRFFSSRGCPYRCSFCYNAKIQDLFKGKGAYVRQKSVENFVTEIDFQVRKYLIKSIFFYDDLFTLNKEWLREFIGIYKKKVNIPFMCTTRANLMDEEVAGMLAAAGCRTVSFGVETGNYEIRRKILHKDISDEEIIRCGHLLHKHGIKTQTANMFCLPDETVRDANGTIELNIKAGTDYAFSALFMPFPNTEITSYCIGRGLLKPDYSLKDLPHSFLTNSVLNVPGKEEIINIHYLAFLFVRYPRFYKTCGNITRFTIFRGVFLFIFILSNFIRHRAERSISLAASLRYAWRMRKSF